MKITITYDDAMQLLARALSMKYDLRQRHFRTTAQILSTGDTAELKTIEFEFYDEKPKELPPTP